jgi:hypothetical protein
MQEAGVCSPVREPTGGYTGDRKLGGGSQISLQVSLYSADEREIVNDIRLFIFAKKAMFQIVPKPFFRVLKCHQSYALGLRCQILAVLLCTPDRARMLRRPRELVDRIRHKHNGL